MTPDIRLARRAVACKGWRWLPGMLNGRDETRYMGALLWAWQDPYRHHALGIEIADWPDLSDPCTLGGLLALVREAWGDDRISSVANVVYGTWMILMPDDAASDGWRLIGCATTEAEALVAALEATAP